MKIDVWSSSVVRIPDVARMLGMSPLIVRRWTKTGRLGCICTKRRRLFVPMSEVRDFICRETVAGPGIHVSPDAEWAGREFVTAHQAAACLGVDCQEIRRLVWMYGLSYIRVDNHGLCISRVDLEILRRTGTSVVHLPRRRRVPLKAATGQHLRLPTKAQNGA